MLDQLMDKISRFRGNLEQNITDTKFMLDDKLNKINQDIVDLETEIENLKGSV